MKKTTLDNGLRIVAEPLPGYRSVSIGVWVKSGSRYENKTNNGISHFIEHMLFKGTEKYDAKQLAAKFDRIGGNVNAYTTKEYTCYYAKVLDEHVPVALDVLSEMLLRPKMDENEFEKEKNIIFEEISMYEDTPDDLVHDLISMAAYGDHALAYPILGTEENLRDLNLVDLDKHMKAYYHGGNTVISVAGKVDDECIQSIERHFSEAKGKGTDVVSQTEPPTFQSDVIFWRKETEQNHICLALPGISYNDPLRFEMILLNNVIGGGMSSRLFQEVREKRGLAYSVYSYHTAYEDCGQFTIYIGTAPNQTEDVLDTILETIGDLLAKGVTDEELEINKEHLKGSFIMSMESSGARMNRLGKNELLLRNHESIEKVMERIESVQHDTIDALMKNMFSVPFSIAAIGEEDRSIQSFGRDQLVISSTD